MRIALFLCIILVIQGSAALTEYFDVTAGAKIQSLPHCHNDRSSYWPSVIFFATYYCNPCSFLELSYLLRWGGCLEISYYCLFTL